MLDFPQAPDNFCIKFYEVNSTQL